MRCGLAVVVLLCGGCFHDVSQNVKKQAHMGEKIAKEILTEGAVAGSELAKKNYIVLASLSSSLGEPKEPLAPTLENVQKTAALMAAEAKANSFFNKVLGVLGNIGQTALSGIPGGGWMLGLLGTITAGLGVLRRKQVQIRELVTTTTALIGGIGEIKKEAGKGTLTEAGVTSIVKTVQRGFKIRSKVESLITGFMSSDKDKATVARAMSNGGK